MDKSEMKEAIIAAKKAKGLGWVDIGEKAKLSPVYTCSACLGMNHLEKDQAEAVADLLDGGAEMASALQEFPHKSWDKIVPTDPVIYRLYEIVGVYGETIKEIIHEKFGDGIMSAIDFSMKIDKEENPAGDRVVITMNGKFLPYVKW